MPTPFICYGYQVVIVYWSLCYSSFISWTIPLVDSLVALSYSLIRKDRINASFILFLGFAGKRKKKIEKARISSKDDQLRISFLWRCFHWGHYSYWHTDWPLLGTWNLFRLAPEPWHIHRRVSETPSSLVWQAVTGTSCSFPVLDLKSAVSPRRHYPLCLFKLVFFLVELSFKKWFF